jgi:hypothetical protein
MKSEGRGVEDEAIADVKDWQIGEGMAEVSGPDGSIAKVKPAPGGAAGEDTQGSQQRDGPRELGGESDDVMRGEGQCGGNNRQRSSHQFLELPKGEPAPDVFLHERVQGDPVERSKEVDGELVEAGVGGFAADCDGIDPVKAQRGRVGGQDEESDGKTEEGSRDEAASAGGRPTERRPVHPELPEEREQHDPEFPGEEEAGAQDGAGPPEERGGGGQAGHRDEECEGEGSPVFFHETSGLVLQDLGQGLADDAEEGFFDRLGEGARLAVVDHAIDRFVAAFLEHAA